MACPYSCVITPISASSPYRVLTAVQNDGAYTIFAAPGDVNTIEYSAVELLNTPTVGHFGVQVVLNASPILLVISVAPAVAL
jgi:hypothetical protein